MKKELLALNMRNLQLFADGSEAGADDNGGAGTEATKAITTVMVTVKSSKVRNHSQN